MHIPVGLRLVFFSDRSWWHPFPLQPLLLRLPFSDSLLFTDGHEVRRLAFFAALGTKSVGFLDWNLPRGPNELT